MILTNNRGRSRIAANVLSYGNCSLNEHLQHSVSKLSCFYLHSAQRSRVHPETFLLQTFFHSDWVDSLPGLGTRISSCILGVCALENTAALWSGDWASSSLWPPTQSHPSATRKLLFVFMHRYHWMYLVNPLVPTLPALSQQQRQWKSPALVSVCWSRSWRRSMPAGRTREGSRPPPPVVVSLLSLGTAPSVRVVVVLSLVVVSVCTLVVVVVCSF